MTVSQVGTRVFVAGTTSGIDTAALIDAAVQQRTIRADRLQFEVDTNTAKIVAYQELETLAENLETALDQLKGNPGFFDDNETAFDLKSGTVVTSDGSDFSSILDIAIDKDAIAGSYEIEVTQIAQAHKVIGTSVADQDADLGYTGTFDLGLSSGGATSNISVVATDSLAEIAAKINAESDITGVNASVIKVSETEYQLSLTGSDTNKNIEVTGVTGTDVLNSVGVTDGIGGFNDVLQIPQGSIVEFDGVTITRDDNNYDDLVAGITLDLKSAAPGTLITLDVDNDTAAAKDAITNFIDTYNALRDFIITNQQVSADGVLSQDAVLFSDNILDGLASTLTNILTENFGNGGNLRTIRDLGLSIGNGNKLEIADETKLDNTILNNFDEVVAVFGASSSSNNPEFTLLSSDSKNTLFRENHPIGVKTNGAGTVTHVEVDGNSSLFDFSGSSFTGKTGTAYEGLTFSYAGTEISVSIEFSFSQGIADRIINSVKDYTSNINGFIVQEKAQLQSQNAAKLEDAKEIVSKAEAYRINQIEKYADFEAKLAQLEILKRQIRAILGNTDDDK
jgi:flagellar hook-associated protein 2